MTETLREDFIDPDLFVRGDPHAIWRRLRASEPVSWTEGRALTMRSGREAWHPGFWNITRYADVFTISRDAQTFISGKGIALTVDAPEEIRRQVEAMGDQIPQMMIESDAPRHTKLRQLVNKGFTPRSIGALEGHIRATTNEIIDELRGKEGCDFVVDVSSKLPLAVICDMLGIPKQDWQLVFDLSNKMLGGDDPEYQGGPGDDVMQFVIFGLFQRLIDERKVQPKNDLITRLVEAEVDGQKLDYLDLTLFGVLLMLAGNETTRNATSGGMLALLENPGQMARLAADPGLLPTAVEEILRWTSPVMHMTRVATKDTEIGGTKIKEGERVAMWYPSANRDESVFPNADVFDIAREPNEHIALGVGEHFCLGANLARLELRVILEEVIRRLDGIEQAGSAERLRSNFIGGIKHMPVLFRAVRN